LIRIPAHIFPVEKKIEINSKKHLTLLNHFYYNLLVMLPEAFVRLELFSVRGCDRRCGRYPAGELKSPGVTPGGELKLGSIKNEEDVFRN
jgi:hypothetical protein